METHVYANDREICSKAADGKSTAFPDTCYSPGAPYPGAPLPYPNTALATDLANGSKTVFICGTPVCLRDESYIGTSMGDDPATEGLAKGVLTGVILGKAYFTSWSMDVKAEGYNVTRHLDSITHNHASKPANTPPTIYMDTPGARGPCADDRRRIEQKCKPEPEDPKRKPKKGLAAGLRKATNALDGLGKGLARYKRDKSMSATGGNAWMDDHCGGLWVTPDYSIDAKFEEALKDTLGKLDDDWLGLLKSAFGELGDLAIEKAGDIARAKLKKFLVKTGVKAVVGVIGSETVIVPIIMGAWTAADLLDTAADLAKLAGPEGKAILEGMTDLYNIEDKAKALLEDYKKNPHKAQADAMEMLAKLNPCTRARKCMLVPYQNTTADYLPVTNETDGTSAPGPLKAISQANHGNGCCPGQTGHHILPGAMFEGTSCGYDHDMAPTICLEGRSNAASHGSHGKAHGALKESIAAYKAKNGDTISYAEAKKQGLDAVEKAGAAHCDRKCLEAQLDAFYAACKNEQLKARSGMGGRQAPSTSGAGNPK
jgi:hypothetical protein